MLPNDSGVLSFFCGHAIQGAMNQAIIPAFERQYNVKVHARYATTVELVKSMADGARCDVIAGVDAGINALVADGTLSGQHQKQLVRTDMGIAVSPGMPMPDIATVADFKAALLSARSVAYSTTGASGIHFVRLLRDMGIEEAINRTATIIPGGLVAEHIVNGNADLAVQQMSELLTVPGITAVTPLPETMRKTIIFSAAIARDSQNCAMAQEFLRFAVSDIAASAYRQFHLVPFHDGS